MKIWNVCAALRPASLLWGWRNQCNVYSTRNPCSTSLCRSQILESQGFPGILALMRRSHSRTAEGQDTYTNNPSLLPAWTFINCKICLLENCHQDPFEPPSHPVWAHYLFLVSNILWSHLKAEASYMQTLHKQADANSNYKFILVYLSSSS